MKLYKVIAVGVALAAVGSCLLAAEAHSPIQVYQDGVRKGEAPPVINFRSPVTGTIQNNAVQVWADAGSSGSGGTVDGGDARTHWLLAIMGSGGTTISALDHVKFDTVAASSGTDCSLDTTTPYTTSNNVASVGRFTLAGDGYKKFLLRFEPGYWTWSSGAGMAQMVWVDVTTGAAVGSGSILAPTTGTSNLLSNGVFSAVVTPSTSTRYEVRVMFQGGTATHGGTSTGPDAGVFKLHPQAWCERLI